MEKVQELRASRAGKIDALDALIKKMGTEEYVESDVDTQAFEEIKKEVDDLDVKIKRTEEVEKLKASLAKPVEGQAKVFATARKRFTKLKAFKGPDAEDNAYASGQWLKAAVFGDEDSKQWCRDNGIAVTRAHSEGVNSAGGVLVPNQMMDSIIDLREEFGVFRKYAKIVPMTSDTLDWPRRTGGLTAYFTAENTAPTESTAAWDNVNLVAKKLAVLTRMSSELSEDAVVSVADILTQEIAYAFASKEDDCGFNGTGTSTYGGIRGITQILIDGSHTAGRVTATTGHDTFAEIDATDLTNLMGALPAYALRNAKFYISQLGFATVFERLIATAGGNSISTLDGAVQYRYLGYPIVISQKLPAVSTTLANSIMLLFGDLSLSSALGERRQVTIKRSDERYFDADQIGLLGTERVDINNHDLGDTSTAGPVVGLMGG